MLAPSLAASLDSVAIRPSCEEFKRLTTAARVTVEVAESRGPNRRDATNPPPETFES